MVSFNSASVLEPVSSEAPCGRDLDSSLELYALEDAAKEPEEPGIKGVSAVDNRNWRDVSARSQALLRESKDIRLVGYLTRALLHTEGLVGFASGINTMRGLVERYWDGLFPALDEADGDPEMRLTALRELWNGHTIAQLRAAPVVSTRELGSFTVNDVLVAKGSPAGRITPNRATAQHVLKAIELCDSETRLRNGDAARAAYDDLVAIAAFVASKVDRHQPFDPALLIGGWDERASKGSSAGLLGALASALGETTLDAHPERGGQNGSESADSGSLLERGQGQTESVPAREPGSRPMQMSGEIQSREDVVRVLDQICKYYERYEPSSPVPILMQRARKLVSMSFVEVVRDMASAGLPQIEIFTGVDSNENS